MQQLHGHEGGQRAHVLHGPGWDEAQVGVEVLLVMGGEAEAGAASPPSIPLHTLHQYAPIPLTPQLWLHHHRLHKQTSASQHSGHAGMANQRLALQHQEIYRVVVT